VNRNRKQNSSDWGPGWGEVEDWRDVGDNVKDKIELNVIVAPASSNLVRVMTGCHKQSGLYPNGNNKPSSLWDGLSLGPMHLAEGWGLRAEGWGLRAEGCREDPLYVLVTSEPGRVGILDCQTITGAGKCAASFEGIYNKEQMERKTFSQKMKD
jgi:hypothetical protein